MLVLVCFCLFHAVVPGVAVSRSTCGKCLEVCRWGVEHRRLWVVGCFESGWLACRRLVNVDAVAFALAATLPGSVVLLQNVQAEGTLVKVNGYCHPGVCRVVWSCCEMRAEFIICHQQPPASPPTPWS